MKIDADVKMLTNERPSRASRPKRPHAVILAGGKGTRLAPLTTVLPKPLMPLGDGPILDVLLRQLAAQGWREVTLAVGHMANLIRAYCGNGSRYGLKLRYLEEEEPLGTVGPLAFLPAAARQRPVLVMNGDLLTSLRFTDLVAAHVASGAVASIAVQRRDVQMDFGVIDLGESVEDSRPILNYREKPLIEATVSMGVYVFEPEAVGLIEPGLRLDLPEFVLRLLERGEKVAGYPFEGYWLDIGRHSDYQKALDDYERIKDALLAPTGAFA
jgi:NDP-sugar pyrophosphorylase family protein